MLHTRASDRSADDEPAQPHKGPVLHLLEEIRSSGLETMLQCAAPHFSAAGYRVIVVGQDPNRPHPFASELAAAGIDVRIISPLPSLRGFIEFRQVLQQVRPSVIHLHSERVYGASVLASRLVSNAPIVRTVHSLYNRKGAKAWLSTRRNRVADRSVDRILLVGPHLASAPENAGRQTSLAWNWVRDEFVMGPTWVRSPRDASVPPNLLIVGNCSYLKRHELALEAALCLGWAVTHVGDLAGAGREELALLQALRNRGRLESWHGDGVAEALRRCDVFAMPSLREGLGVAAMEALCVGVPVVASRGSGLDWVSEYGGHLAADNSWEGALKDSLAQPGPSPLTGLARHRFAPKSGVAVYVDTYDALTASTRAARSRRNVR